jgi:two-component system response regulator DesR
MVEQELTVMLVVPSLKERLALRTLVEKDQLLRVVCEADDADAALTLARQFRPDIAILDHSLPSASPLDVAHLLSRTCPAIQSLVLTDHDGRDWIVTALRAGVRAFVLKSSAQAHLLPALGALEAHQPYWQGAVDQEIVDELLVGSSPISRTQQEEETIEHTRSNPRSSPIADVTTSNDTRRMRSVLLVLILGLALAVWVFLSRP